MSFEVYKITNNITKKNYIGITTQGVETRFKKHIVEANNGGNRYLCKSIRKYGIDNFIVKLVDSNINSYEDLLEKEKYYIKKYNTFIPNGYNMTLGGEGAIGRPMQDVTKEKIRQSKLGSTPWNKGKKCPQLCVEKGKMSAEGVSNISKAKKGKKLSEKTKIKRKYIYERMKGEDHPLYGVGHTEESKKKMSLAKMGQGTVKYRCYNNVDENIFDSLKNAVSFLGIKSHAGIVKASKNSTEYRGYFWEKLI